MDDFRRQFLIEAGAALARLSEDFRNAEPISDAVRRDAFRTLHTIKGTAQTFGFSAASRLAHELENLLSAEARQTAESNVLFSEGVGLLTESLKRENFEVPAWFVEKIQNAAPQKITSLPTSDDLPGDLPNEIFSQLSAQEKTALRSAWHSGKNIYCLEIGFALANFADELINFRETLNAAGEIIATLPGAKFTAHGKIGFQILYASADDESKIEFVAEAHAAEIIFQSPPNVFSDDAPGVLARIVGHGKEIARKLDKRIEFQISTDETANIPPAHLKIIFDTLLHLVRNAVDHAFETAGEIRIDLQTEKDGWRLRVSDDGRGIDLERVKADALEKKLIAADAILGEQETLDLIFTPEFSTKTDVTEISGRGIGLDAARFALENAGGTINVRSRSGKGTTFEIFLPR